MTEIRVGGLVFDGFRYDARGEVLYLHVGPPRAAVDGDETPEVMPFATTPADG